MSKYGHRPHNWFEGIVNKLGGEEGAERFLRGEVIMTEPNWYEDGGIIYLLITSDGTTGGKWIDRLPNKGVFFDNNAKNILRSYEFKATTGVTTKIAICSGVSLVQKGVRLYEDVLFEGASQLGFEKPTAEDAVLIREKITAEDFDEMGFAHIVMLHNPVYHSPQVDSMLTIFKGRLSSCKSDGRFPCGDAFAFVISRTSIA